MNCNPIICIPPISSVISKKSLCPFVERCEVEIGKIVARHVSYRQPSSFVLEARLLFREFLEQRKVSNLTAVLLAWSEYCERPQPPPILQVFGNLFFQNLVHHPPNLLTVYRHEEAFDVTGEYVCVFCVVVADFFYLPLRLLDAVERPFSFPAAIRGVYHAFLKDSLKA